MVRRQEPAFYLTEADVDKFKSCCPDDSDSTTGLTSVLDVDLNQFSRATRRPKRQSWVARPKRLRQERVWYLYIDSQCDPAQSQSSGSPGSTDPPVITLSSKAGKLYTLTGNDPTNTNAEQKLVEVKLEGGTDGIAIGDITAFNPHPFPMCKGYHRVEFIEGVLCFVALAPNALVDVKLRKNSGSNGAPAQKRDSTVTYDALDPFTDVVIAGATNLAPENDTTNRLKNAEMSEATWGTILCSDPIKLIATNEFPLPDTYDVAVAAIGGDPGGQSSPPSFIYACANLATGTAIPDAQALSPDAAYHTRVNGRHNSAKIGTLLRGDPPKLIRVQETKGTAPCANNNP